MTAQPVSTTTGEVATLLKLPEPLRTLQVCSEHGWLRRLDSAMACFVAEQDPAAHPALLVAVALVAHLEGRGHTCLPLAPILSNPAWLAWPNVAQPTLAVLMRELPADLPSLLACLRASSLVRCANAGLSEGQALAPDQGQPLVLDGEVGNPRLYLRRYWVYEQQVMLDLQVRMAVQRTVDPQQARAGLDQLFDRNQTRAPAQPDWQKMACALALGSHFSVITGGPGTGKTYTAARLLALIWSLEPAPERLRVALAAPTGKAAARLRASIDTALQELDARVGEGVDLPALAARMGPARTLHALLGARPDTRSFAFHAGRPLDVDVLIVDEASMVHLEMMAALLQALPASTRLILLGDKDQLASVEAGAVLGDVCRHAAQGRYSPETRDYLRATTGEEVPTNMVEEGATPALAQHTVMLRESRRFGGPIGQLALAVNRGQSDETLQLLSHDASAVLMHIAPAGAAQVVALAVRNDAQQAQASYADYLRVVRSGAPRPDASISPVQAHTAWVLEVLQQFERFRILCAVHDGDWGTRALNQGVARALAHEGLLTISGDWYAGRPVMVTRNDAALGVFNGDIGVVLPSAEPGAGLKVYFLDGEQVRGVGVGRMAAVETAFAMTVHKSQGSEFAHTVVVLPPGSADLLTRELAYTAITRARQHLTVCEGASGLLQAALGRPTQRSSGLNLDGISTFGHKS
jgi:exodeoxyribonuclease V alpha subunit